MRKSVKSLQDLFKPPAMGFEKQKFRATKFGNVPVHCVIDNKEYHFRSKLEYRWAQHLEFMRMGGVIIEWSYESHKFTFNNPALKVYIPDFAVRTAENELEYHETKGHLAKYDITKYQMLFEERPEVKIILIFWQKPKISVQKKDKIERYCHRVIYDAAKMIKREPIDMS